MQQALYSGFVIHNRVFPKQHKFKYNLTMYFLDVDLISETFKKIPFISVEKFNFLSFYRKNYLPSKNNLSLRQEVERQLRLHGYEVVPVKIFILTHLAYFGYCYNPVSFFYCYDASGNLIYLISEVNNTPWNERFVYVQEIKQQKIHKSIMNKEFHVSPFLPMDIEYVWNTNNPHRVLNISMACRKNKPIFYASMRMYKKKLNSKNCLQALLLKPFSTQLVLLRIYWQALFLFLKRIPFYKHPERNQS